ncbi:GMP synthase, partial [Caulochytrium protostelioides]
MTADKSLKTDVSELFDTILILDFGSQYTHLIARRIREFGVYCELFACNIKLSDLHFKPKGVILSGGPNSVYDADSPHPDPAIWELGVPILGICYGLQEIAWHHGGKVDPSDKAEYGQAKITINPDYESQLLKGIDDFTMWMSHGDQLSSLPASFKVTATTPTAPFAAIEDHERQLYGCQFHPEVTHSKQGHRLLKNFTVDICQASTNWSMKSFIETEIERIRNTVGPHDQVIGAVSGGVDSTVAAKLMSEAIGDRFHAILVDNGVMRMDECKNVEKILTQHLKINLTVVDASEQFLGRLAGVTDPEKKRKIIGNTFIEVFEAEAERLEKKFENVAGAGKFKYLLQGTLYPDVIESISFKGPSATIKTHHNVGGLLENMKLDLIEPLRELFKDEVRALGSVMGIDDELIWRHPFPGPGIAIRILGEVTRSQVEIVQRADKIYIEEIKKAGLYRKISQAYAALLPVRAVGVMGDNRTYEQV